MAAPRSISAVAAPPASGVSASRIQAVQASVRRRQRQVAGAGREVGDEQRPAIAVLERHRPHRVERRGDGAEDGVPQRRQRGEHVHDRQRRQIVAGPRLGERDAVGAGLAQRREQRERPAGGEQAAGSADPAGPGGRTSR